LHKLQKMSQKYMVDVREGASPNPPPPVKYATVRKGYLQERVE